MRTHWWKAALLGMALLAIPSVMVGYTMTAGCNKVKAAEMESEAQGAYGVLTWPQNLNAVRRCAQRFGSGPAGGSGGISKRLCIYPSSDSGHGKAAGESAAVLAGAGL